MNLALYTEALRFAAHLHAEQRRKYTGAPYITHPIAVAETVRKIGGTDEMIAAALLHDTVEDCEVPLPVIEWKFGKHVARLVGFLTDEPSVPGGPNRAARKEITKARLAAAPASAQTIKVADLLDNTASIVQYDREFSVVYLAEKMGLLEVLTKADRVLRSRAFLQVQAAQCGLWDYCERQPSGDLRLAKA